MAGETKTFEEMLDELYANIKRIKAELAREEAAFSELPV
jgi:septation ring formation regulator EzrA